MTTKETRISLGTEDFETLIKGNIVSVGGVKIALKDIGFDTMIDIIMDVKHYGYYRKKRRENGN